MRLLLVEDNKILRESLKKSLQSESFVVDIASEGAKGSYMARTNDYDLILLDNGLPEKKRIGSLPRNSQPRQKHSHNHAYDPGRYGYQSRTPQCRR